VCALPQPWQFSEKPWSYGDSWDRQAFQYFSGTSTFYRLGRVGTAQTEIASQLLARQYLGLIHGAHTLNLPPS
jgi:hypothetical protein